MLNWRLRCAITGLISCCSTIFAGCGGARDPAVITPSSITPSSVLLFPGQTAQFSKIGQSADTNLVWLVNGVVGGSPSAGTITSSGLYTAPGTVPGRPAMVSVQSPSVASVVNFFDPSRVSPGSVVPTGNPLVAAYAIPVPVGTLVRVQFGLDTGYGFSTSAVTAPPDGGYATVLVAGMRAGTTYHMQAIIDLSDGTKVMDTDHTFTTGSIPADRLPNMTAEQLGVGTPSPGVELFSLDPFNPGNLLSAVATDLDGNLIWYYDLPPNTWAFPIKPLPNGHMLVNVFPTGTGGTPVGVSGPNEVREVDLAGNIINRVSLATVNLALASIVPFQLDAIHHDVTVLPNGHWILLGSYTENVNNVAGIPDGTEVAGDALIDWDLQRGPVWTWSTFDHLDVAHNPYGIANGFADWTHANAIIYSPDDGNLILSMRNQNWIIKINYQNGEGDGNILWRFGPGGDFTLPGQEAPIEWNYGQHYPTIVSPNSAGVFSLMFFDNGNNRLMDANNDVCGTADLGACYSDVPVFQVDETAKTASVVWEDNLLPSYSICCGDALVLPSGNVEFDIAYDVNTPDFSHIEEVTQTQTPELIWKMDIEGQLAYRGFRIPSLYPGEVWPATVPSISNHHPLPELSHASRTGESPRKIEQLP